MATEDTMKMFTEMMRQMFTQMQSNTATASSSVPKFEPFDPTSELWNDYLQRFQTFISAYSVPDGKVPQVFLTNQDSSIYKMISNKSLQQQNPKQVNALSFDEIIEIMKEQYDPTLFTVRERYQFWKNTNRKPGETIQDG